MILTNSSLTRHKDMIIDDITYTMEYIEEIARNLGDILPKESYYIEDEGCPHKQPSLPNGYAAIYIFTYGTGTEYKHSR